MNFKQIQEILKELSEQGKSNSEHIAKLNDETGSIEKKFDTFELKNAEEHASIKTDMQWVKWLCMGIALAIIGLVFTSIK